MLNLNSLKPIQGITCWIIFTAQSLTCVLFETSHLYHSTRSITIKKKRGAFEYRFQRSVLKYPK